MERDYRYLQHSNFLLLPFLYFLCLCCCELFQAVRHNRREQEMEEGLAGIGMFIMNKR